MLKQLIFIAYLYIVLTPFIRLNLFPLQEKHNEILKNQHVWLDG